MVNMKKHRLLQRVRTGEKSTVRKVAKSAKVRINFSHL